MARVMATLPYDRVFAASREDRAMNVEAQVTWTDGERFVANASSGHGIVIDSDRQRNTAAGPMEMVLMGLCACTATDVVSILRKKREPFVGVHVKAEAVAPRKRPRFILRSNLSIRFPGRFHASQWKMRSGCLKKSIAGSLRC